MNHLLISKKIWKITKLTKANICIGINIQVSGPMLVLEKGFNSNFLKKAKK